MATVTQAQPTAPPSVGPNTQKIVGRILIYVVLIAIAIVILLPLVWMVSTSLKPK
jgi:ABC-type glycerol-3-phosphate transport system permease component